MNLKTDIVFEVTSPLEPYAKVGKLKSDFFRIYGLEVTDEKKINKKKNLKLKKMFLRGS